MTSELPLEELISPLLAGDEAGAREVAERLLQSGFTPERLVTHGVCEAMVQLDARCTLEQFNLLEIMLVGRAVMGVMKTAFPGSEAGATTGPSVVLANLEGDVHDLGKSIFRIILTAHGYRVVDCGTDCSVALTVETAQCEDAIAIGVSGTLSAVIPQVRTLRQACHEAELEDILLLVGGAGLQNSDASSLAVDFVARTAFDGARFLDHSLGR